MPAATPAQRRPLHRPIVGLLPLGAALLLAQGCGGAGAKPGAGATGGQTPYQARCASLEAERAAEISNSRYLPTTLLLHRWPKPKAMKKGDDLLDRPGALPELQEDKFAGLLVRGDARATLLIARGGTGKSKLGWSLEAQTCNQLPTVRLDLQWDVAASESKGPKRIEALVKERLGVANPETALAGKAWLLLLDSLDEVPLTERKAIVEQVNAVLAKYKSARAVVLTRPPVYTGNYGLTALDAFVELPQLSCARTDAALKRLIPDPAERDTIAKFTHRYGLDRKVHGQHGRCWYTHMSTYRDFFIVRKLALAHAVSAASVAQRRRFSSSRAKVYGFYLSVLLIKDLQGVGLLPGDAMALIDKLIAAHNPGAGDRNLVFDMAGCTTQVGGDAAKAKSVCERLLQSSVFSPATTGGGFRLKNQTIYDLFLARWADGKLGLADGGSDDATTACAPVRAMGDLFESNEVAGFLVGLKGGQRCLIPIAEELCRRGGFAEHNFEQLDQGLPFGEERIRVIADARRSVAKDGEPHMCTGALLDRLQKGATDAPPAKTPATPAPATPAPAAPAPPEPG